MTEASTNTIQEPNTKPARTSLRANGRKNNAEAVSDKTGCKNTLKPLSQAGLSTPTNTGGLRDNANKVQRPQEPSTSWVLGGASAVQQSNQCSQAGHTAPAS